jgi:Ger(x)C family germination protein
LDYFQVIGRRRRVKRLKRIILSTSVLLCLLILEGCWDAKELDDLAVPLVVTFDTILESEKEYPDDKFLVSLGIPIFYEDAEKKFHVVETSGKIVGDARERRNSQLGEQVIFGQMQLLLIGEELAKTEDLLEITDILTRNPSVKASLFVVVVKGRAVDLINKPIHDYPNVGLYLKALLKGSKDTIFYPYTTLFDLNRELLSYETAVLVPHIIYRGEHIVLAGSCLVNKGRVAGDLGRDETETAVMLRGINCRGILAFDALKDGEVIDEATFAGTNSRKVIVKREGGKYIFNIQIKLAGIIVEHKEQNPMQDGTDLIKVFQDSLEQHIKKRAEAFIEKTQEEYKFDALCLANYIKAHTREKLTKEDIDKIVQESEINVEVKVKIRNAGGKM